MPIPIQRKMSLTLLSADVQRHDIATRMPFKYGIATMTEVPHVFVSVTIRIDGKESTGCSADHLPPKWFTKEPDVPVDKEIADMELSLQQALDAARGFEAPSPFAFWQELYSRLMTGPAFPPLLQHFGISLVERAVLDAVCRQAGKPLWELVRDDQLGIDLGQLSPELQGSCPADYLPGRPLPSVNLRHTVGMADFLREGDIPEEERLDDGLPQSLEACIRTYGLHEFKLKLGGNMEADLQRMRDIAAVINEFAKDDFRFSLDGNEQYTSPGDLHAFAEQVYADPVLEAFFAHLFFIEQPISRKVALAEGAPDISRAWPRPVPIIIDESDGSLQDLPRALDLGYAGTSHKNCKGVFKGIRNRCLLGSRQKAQPHRRFLMTGEDLANIGPVALLQDLAVQALLGNDSVERNGHHYFRGLRMFPKETSEQILAQHPQLYEADAGGYARLRVQDGRIDLSSVNARPFAIA